MEKQTIAYLILILIGLIFIFVGWILFVLRRSKKSRCSTKTIAKVSGFSKKEASTSNSSGIKNSYLIRLYEFQANGQTHLVDSKIEKTFTTTKIGTEFILFYNPSNPNDWYVPKEIIWDWIPFIFTFIGLILLFCLALIYFLV